jgi:hypothetical protein
MKENIADKAYILVSTLIESSQPPAVLEELTEELRSLQAKIDVVVIAKAFGASKIIRKLRLPASKESALGQFNLHQINKYIYWKEHSIGSIAVLYKTPIPGELQARLAVENAVERFIEYLQKVHHIAALEESDRHVRLFIPGDNKPDFGELWKLFVEKVAFSTYGDSRHQLPGLLQTFVLMMNSVTLADRGFSTLDIPIVTQDQANVLAALYYAVFKNTHKRQQDRRAKINKNIESLDQEDLTEKDKIKVEKEIGRDEDMQAKEAEKYTDNFQKFVVEEFRKQAQLWEESRQYQLELDGQNLNAKEKKAIQKKQDKANSKITFTEPFIRQRLAAISDENKDPFIFIDDDQKKNPTIFKAAQELSRHFTKTATDQISAVKGDIFAKCILEMYRLLDDVNYAKLTPLLTEQPAIQEIRSASDDGRDFCYACGCAISKTEASWKVARFMFERPYQRRQSSANEGQPLVCSSCAALSFASPLKVSDKSIILRLDSQSQPNSDHESSDQKLKDYIRMLTSKEVHLCAGRYIVLTANKVTKNGKDVYVSKKLGELQFSLAKVASTFPLDVLKSFKFSLFMQSSEPVSLRSRDLVFIKGIMDGYFQPIVLSGQEINMRLGEAIRYVQQDLPYLAEYTLLTKSPAIPNSYELERVRESYWQIFNQDTIHTSGDSMEKRQKLYQDVAALTGILFPFANKLDREPQAQIPAEKEKEQKDIDREISKLIEQVADSTSFCYYATLGVNKKVQAFLYKGRDNHFIYQQAKALLEAIGLEEREEIDETKNATRLQLYADDISKVYAHFAGADEYSSEREWKELTYQLKLSLYTRFPRLVRKLKTTETTK